MFLGPAREWKQGKFSLAGQGYPKQVCWTPNVECLDRLSSPVQRRRFYNSQGFSLNVSAADCDEGNLCPSTGLFEAAACGTPAISDYWEGLEQFFQPGEDILVASCGEESLCYLLAFSDEERARMGKRARSRVLAKHSIQQRALELETYAQEILKFSRTSHD
jgi:spore maturation protein CgeB